MKIYGPRGASSGLSRDTRAYTERARAELKLAERQQARDAKLAQQQKARAHADEPARGPARKPASLVRSELLGTKVTREEADRARQMALGHGGMSDWLRGLILRELEAHKT